MLAAVALMSHTKATATHFLSPYVTMMLAILFLRERKIHWRWGAVIPGWRERRSAF